MDTIYWLAEKILGLGITALLVVFQPELRKGLEKELGKKKFLQGHSFAGSRAGGGWSVQRPDTQ